MAVFLSSQGGFVSQSQVAAALAAGPAAVRIALFLRRRVLEACSAQKTLAAQSCLEAQIRALGPPSSSSFASLGTAEA